MVNNRNAIWTAILTLLKNDPILKWVDEIKEGTKDELLAGKKAKIIMYGIQMDETYMDYPTRKQQELIIGIKAILDIKGRNDYIWVGNNKRKGIFDFEDDIFNCIEGKASVDLTLGGICYKPEFRTVAWDEQADVFVAANIEATFKGKITAAGAR